MLKNRTVVATLLVFVSPMVLCADTPITALGRKANVVIMGSLSGIEKGPIEGQFTLTLTVARTLKGLEQASIVAGLAPDDSFVTPTILPISLVGQSGIWFLSESGSGTTLSRPELDGFFRMRYSYR